MISEFKQIVFQSIENEQQASDVLSAGQQCQSEKGPSWRTLK